MFSKDTFENSTDSKSSHTLAHRVFQLDECEITPYWRMRKIIN
jgi:hypothetical protein